MPYVTASTGFLLVVFFWGFACAQQELFADFTLDPLGNTSNCASSCFDDCSTCFGQVALFATSESPACDSCKLCPAECVGGALCQTCISGGYIQLNLPVCDICLLRDPQPYLEADQIPKAFSCSHYCDLMEQNCFAENQIYTSRQECLDTCGTFRSNPDVRNYPPIKNSNTLQCRVVHANYASLLPSYHCPHAAPESVVCRDLDCIRYCYGAETYCTGPFQLFSSTTECLETCATYKRIPIPEIPGQSFYANESDGTVLNDADSLECREWFVDRSKLLPFYGCPRAAPDSERCLGVYLSYTNQFHMEGRSEPVQALLGTLSNADRREYLYKYNLIDPYFSVNQAYPTVSCPPDSDKYRTADGRCNQPSLNAMGMKGVRMGRNTPPSFEEPEEIFQPNPILLANLISRQRLLGKEREFEESPLLNLWAVGWIQFMTHDWFDHKLSDVEEISVPLLNGGFVNVPATELDEGWTVNTATHWWDASQLYGSDIETIQLLRSGSDGKLKLTPTTQTLIYPQTSGGNSARNISPVPNAGVNANWWLGLELQHILWSREHNFVVEQLAERYPALRGDDEALFQIGRLIIAAALAKIHTLEWTPAVQQNPSAILGLTVNWFGKEAFPDDLELEDDPSTADFDEKKSLEGLLLLGQRLPGVGGTSQLFGSPFFMSEEFTSVYRMHPLLPDVLTVSSAEEGTNLVEDVELGDVSFGKSRRFVENHKLEDLVYSFGVEKAGALSAFNYPDALTHLTLPDGSIMNVAVLDILRDRERGLPRYNDFREALHFERYVTIDQINPDPEVTALLKEMYDDDVDKVDLLVGQLAEEPRPAGYGFSLTTNQIFIIQASRRLHADRFYQENFTPEIYTDFGMEYIDTITMKSVIERHFPRLAENLDNGSYAFTPWTRTSLPDEAEPSCPPCNCDSSTSIQFNFNGMIPKNECCNKK